MPKITNHKITDLTPTWADFRGFSLLFDNPNPAENLLDIGNNLYKINCSKSDTSIAFCQTLSEVLDNLGLGNSTNDYLFCPLPFSSYHVTYLDGISNKDKENLNPIDKVDFDTFLKNLPVSLKSGTRFTNFQNAHISEQLQKPIHFEWDKLSNWGNKVLAVQLKPTVESSDVYQMLMQKRGKIFKEFLCELDFSKQPERRDYVPHISLGYFANKDGGELSLAKIEGWTDSFRKMLEGKTITFDRFSLYGFTDMVTFIKVGQ
ncbi:MAG: hypothetical protein AB8B69_13990 [Chitinophagales bacterium]